jgi:thiosulfate dehydrogenase
MRKNQIDKNYIIRLTKIMLNLTYGLLLFLLLFVTALVYAPEINSWITNKQSSKSEVNINSTNLIVGLWQAPAESSIPDDEAGELIRYGRNLISNTSVYLGPKGSVMAMSNGMNCQNCHLDAGTKAFGNNYSAVASTYPKFRPRSGTEESIEKRVNDCFERSLNGQSLAAESKEMQAIVAYILWLGKDVPKGEVPKGAGILELEFLTRAADPVKGKIKYQETCTICHGTNGEGFLNEIGNSWIYPPLWGENSYNTGAGLYRLSKMAGYIKVNMPLGATFLEPQLSDEDAWDIAAYVNSLPHPIKDISMDWPDISQKPIDHPFGPFSDEFSEEQHKFGPFIPISKRIKKFNKPAIANN